MGCARVHRRRQRRHHPGRPDPFRRVPGLRRLAGWTEAHYLTLAPHNVGGPVATAANIHFAVATRTLTSSSTSTTSPIRGWLRSWTRRRAWTRSTAASRSRSGRGWVCAWTTTRAHGIRARERGSSCSWTAGRSGTADPSFPGRSTLVGPRRQRRSKRRTRCSRTSSGWSSSAGSSAWRLVPSRRCRRSDGSARTPWRAPTTSRPARSSARSTITARRRACAAGRSSCGTAAASSTCVTPRWRPRARRSTSRSCSVAGRSSSRRPGRSSPTSAGSAACRTCARRRAMPRTHRP